MENLTPEVTGLLLQVAHPVQNEAQTVLSNIFESVKDMSEKLESIKVQNENDVIGMSMANKLRLGIRAKRLEAEKLLNAKRKDVQTRMSDFVAEDKLWLKTSQIVDKLTKDLEAKALYLENTHERIQKQSFDAIIAERMKRLQPIAPHVNREDIEQLSDANFEAFLAQMVSDFPKFDEQKLLDFAKQIENLTFPNVSQYTTHILEGAKERINNLVLYLKVNAARL